MLTPFKTATSFIVTALTIALLTWLASWYWNISAMVIRHDNQLLILIDKSGNIKSSVKVEILEAQYILLKGQVDFMEQYQCRIKDD